MIEMLQKTRLSIKLKYYCKNVVSEYMVFLQDNIIPLTFFSSSTKVDWKCQPCMSVVWKYNIGKQEVRPKM